MSETRRKFSPQTPDGRAKSFSTFQCFVELSFIHSSLSLRNCRFKIAARVFSPLSQLLFILYLTRRLVAVGSCAFIYPNFVVGGSKTFVDCTVLYCTVINYCISVMRFRSVHLIALVAAAVSAGPLTSNDG